MTGFSVTFLLSTYHIFFVATYIGAHYLSDVTMGGTIGFVTVIVGISILDKKYFASA